METIRLFIRCTKNSNFFHYDHDSNNQSDIWYGGMPLLLHLLNFQSYEVNYNISTNHPVQVNVASVYDGYGDVGPFNQVFTAKRAQYIDFSFPIRVPRIVVFTRSSEGTEIDPLESVFTPLIWYALLLTVFLSIIMVKNNGQPCQ